MKPIPEVLSERYDELLRQALRYELALIQVSGCQGCPLCRAKAKAALEPEKAETE